MNSSLLVIFINEILGTREVLDAIQGHTALHCEGAAKPGKKIRAEIFSELERQCMFMTSILFYCF